MSSISHLQLGDIVWWVPQHMVYGRESEKRYGMIIRELETFKGGRFSYGLDAGEQAPMTLESMLAITIFSFGDQRVITLYQNPEEFPLIVNKVDFNRKKA